MSFIEGKVSFYEGANETPESSAEKTQETYDGLKSLEASIKTNVYTDEKANSQNNKDKYRLKASSINFLEIQDKTLSTKEYGNSEFDHMIKNLLIIQGNKNKAGEKYNELTGGNYQIDDIGTIFNNLITFMKDKGLDRPQDRTGAYTNADFLYMVGLGQALVIRDKKEGRTDYSANKVSENFGDYMLGFNSMTDFASMGKDGFKPFTEILNKENELEQLKDEINQNNATGNTEIQTNEQTDVSVTGTGQDTTENTTENISEQQESVSETREFPKTKQIYIDGNDEYFFDNNDVQKRGIVNTEYLPIMYASLNIDSDLQGIEEKDQLKEFVGLLLQQADKVISELKEGIVIQSEFPIEDVQYSPGYIFEKIAEEPGNYKVKISFNKEGITKIFDPANQEENLGKFSKTVLINGKEEQIVINTWTPEMVDAYNTSVMLNRPIGNRKGQLKKRFVFEASGISVDKIYAEKREKKEIGVIAVGDRELFKSRDFESVAQR